MFNSRPHRAGFTIVELLVVISIIAVLISILIPSLGQARDKSKGLVCQINTRTQAGAILSYAGDSKSLLPFYTENFDQYHLEARLMQQGYLTVQGVMTYGVGSVSNAIKCPVGLPTTSWSTATWTATPGIYRNGVSAAVWLNAEYDIRRLRQGSSAGPYMDPNLMVWSHYNYNGRHPSWGSGYPLANWPEGTNRSLDGVHNPANTWASSDGNYPDFGIGSVTWRHLSKANFSYLDGHSDMLGWADVDAGVVAGNTIVVDSRMNY